MCHRGFAGGGNRSGMRDTGQGKVPREVIQLIILAVAIVALTIVGVLRQPRVAPFPGASSRDDATFAGVTLARQPDIIVHPGIG